MDDTLRDICDRLLELIYEDESQLPLEILSAADELRDYISNSDEEE
jgi:hypothetical protein